MTDGNANDPRQIHPRDTFSERCSAEIERNKVLADEMNRNAISVSVESEKAVVDRTPWSRLHCTAQRVLRTHARMLGAKQQRRPNKSSPFH